MLVRSQAVQLQTAQRPLLQAKWQQGSGLSLCCQLLRRALEYFKFSNSGCRNIQTQAQLLCQLPSQCSDGVEGEEEGDRTAANVAMLADDSAYLGFFSPNDYVSSPLFFLTT